MRGSVALQAPRRLFQAEACAVVFAMLGGCEGLGLSLLLLLLLLLQETVPGLGYVFHYALAAWSHCTSILGSTTKVLTMHVPKNQTIP